MAARPGPYSPDGRFWWDGTAWQPVQPPPPDPATGQPHPQSHPQQQQQPAAPYQPPPPQPQYGPPGQPGFQRQGFQQHGFQAPPGYPVPPGGGTPRPPRSRSGFVLLTIGTAIAALVLGGIIGGVVGLTTTKPKGENVVPAFAEKFPDADAQYLPGVTLSMIVDDWMKTANKWKCTKDPNVEDLYSRAKAQIKCEPPDDRGDMYVDIEYDADDKIKVVEASCWLGVHTKACKSLAATMADAVLAAQPKLRKKAQKWAEQNAGSERATTIGGIRFEGNLDPNGMQALPAI